MEVALPDLTTDRILFRPFDRADIGALHALWTAPEVRRWLWDDIVISEDTAAEVVRISQATAAQGIGMWSLYIPPHELPDDRSMDGFCGFRFIDDGPDVELMYGLRHRYWGKGLAVEACREALAYLWGHTNLAMVYARTDPPNLQSIAVMERLGMAHHLTTPAMVTYVLQRPRASEVPPS